MNKEQKKLFVKQAKDTLDKIGLLVITHYSGLKTTETGTRISDVLKYILFPSIFKNP